MCNPKIECYKENTDPGWVALVTQPWLNDNTYAEEKYMPSIGRVGWSGRVIYRHNLILRTPDNYFYWTYDPTITIKDPTGHTETYNFLNWRVENATD